jgi:hypothetical protein
MLPEYFVIVGGLVLSLGSLYYFYETIRGKAKPNRATWLLWGIFPLVIFIGQRAQGVDTAAFVSLASGSIPFLVVVASFLNKRAYWKTQAFDYVCAGVAAGGIILWALTNNAYFAIAFALFADAVAALPTIIKAYKYPETESWIAFALGAAGATICILALKVWTFENYAFIVWIFVVNTVIAVLAFRKPSKDPLAVEL